MDNKIGAVIQARFNSSRFSGKVLRKLPVSGEKNTLDHIVNMLSTSSIINEIVIATSILKENDLIEEYFLGKAEVFRGSEEDVLSRFYLISKHYNLDHIIRLTGDNPIVDIKILESTVKYHVTNNFEYTKTLGLPLGINIEVFTCGALEKAFINAKSASEREHVTPYLINHDDINKGIKTYEPCEAIKDIRLTMDYPSDYAMLNLLFQTIGKDDISLEDIKKIIIEEPWIKDINRGNVQEILV